MNLYPIVLFAHIAGALGLAFTLGLESLSLEQMRRAATLESLRSWLNVTGMGQRVGVVSMLLVVAAGVYLMIVGRYAVPWLFVSLATLVVVAALGAALTGRRMAALRRAITEAASLAAVQERVSDPMLLVSIRVRMMLFLTIVFLMTVKPDALFALVVVAVALVLGLAPQWVARRRVRTA